MHVETFPPASSFPKKLFSRTAHCKYCKQVRSQFYPSGSGWKDRYLRTECAGPDCHSRTHGCSSPSEMNKQQSPLLLCKTVPTPACAVKTSMVFSSIPDSITASKSCHEKDTSCHVMLPSVALHEAAT